MATVKKMVFYKALETIKGGGELTLDVRQDQYGDWIADEWLRFDHGRWLHGQINCISSSQFGLGTCQCFSHPAYIEDEISRQEALDLIQRYVENKVRDELERQKEVAFLNLLWKAAEEVIETLGGQG